MKAILSFTAIFLAITALVAWYISHRMGTSFPTIPRRVWAISIVGIMSCVIISMMFYAVSTTSNLFGRTAYQFCGIAIAVLMMLLFATIAVDLVNLLARFSPHTRGVLSLSLTCMLLLYALINSYTPQVKELTIAIKGLNKEIRLVQLTDIHLGNFRGANEVKKLVKKINALNPDVVMNTGDLFDARYPLEKATVLDGFKALKAPQYFVFGNHDQHVGVREVVAQAKAAGMLVLENEVAQFGELQIVGLNNMAVDSEQFDVHASPKDGTIKDVLNHLVIDQSKPTVVLHHRPVGEKYMQEHGADLLLAGHTHAGQLFPATLIAKSMFTFNSGLYDYLDMKIYVSEGSGTFFTPIRLGARSEITHIRLVPQE
ncbi:MAG: metallophosphoesterase [Mangrovibacterium sp.]